MRLIVTFAAISTAIPLGAAPEAAVQFQSHSCIYVSEQIRGSLKVCTYNCGGAPYTLTVRPTDPCPFNP